jgi:hypothetical protein
MIMPAGRRLSISCTSVAGSFPGVRLPVRATPTAASRASPQALRTRRSAQAMRRRSPPRSQVGNDVRVARASRSAHGRATGDRGPRPGHRRRGLGLLPAVDQRLDPYVWAASSLRDEVEDMFVRLSAQDVGGQPGSGSQVERTERDHARAVPLELTDRRRGIGRGFRRRTPGDQPRDR